MRFDPLIVFVGLGLIGCSESTPRGGISFEVDQTPVRVGLSQTIGRSVRVIREPGNRDKVRFESGGAMAANGERLTTELYVVVQPDETEAMLDITGVSIAGGIGVATIEVRASDTEPTPENDPDPDVFALDVHAVGSTDLMDPSFGSNGVFTPSAGTPWGGEVRAIELTTTGAVLVAGVFYGSGSWPSLPVMRLTADGQLDPTFATATNNIAQVTTSPPGGVNGLFLDDNQRIICIGSTTGKILIARYTPSGQPDTTFAPGGVVVDTLSPSPTIYTASRAPDGSLFVGGVIFDGTDGFDYFVAKYLPTGARDGTFGSGGIVTKAIATTTDAFEASVLRPDNSLVTAGHAGVEGLISAFTPTGQPDAGFANGGELRDGNNVLALVRDGSATLVAQADYAGDQFVVRRMHADGSFDPAFELQIPLSPALPNSPRRLALAPGSAGSWFGVGTVETIAGPDNGDRTGLAVRFDGAGTLDPTFGVQGQHVSQYAGSSGFNALRVLPDGSVIVGGHQAKLDPPYPTDWLVVKYLP